MGLVSDTFKRRIDEMKARHEQTDREIAELIRDTQRLRENSQRIWENIDLL